MGEVVAVGLVILALGTVLAVWTVGLGASLLLYGFLVASIWWRPIGAVGKFNVTILDLVTAQLWCIVLLYIARRHGALPRHHARAVGLALLVALLGIMSGIGPILQGDVDGFITAVLTYLKRWGAYSILPAASLVLVGKEGLDKSCDRLWKALLLEGIVLTFFAVAVPESGRRATSMVFNPNVFGLMGTIMVSTGVAELEFNRRSHLGSWSIAAGLMAVIFSGSRTAIVGLAGVFAYWILNRDVRLRWVRPGCLIVIIPLVVAAAYVGRNYIASTVDRIVGVVEQGLGTPEVAERLELWEIGAVMLLDRPIFGYGAGQLQRVSAPMVHEYGNMIRGPFYTTDNQFVDILLEAGLLGLALAACVLVFLWVMSAPPACSMRQRDTCMRYSHAVRGVLVGFLVAGFGMQSFSSPFASAQLWFLVALATLARHRVEVEGKRGRARVA